MEEVAAWQCKVLGHPERLRLLRLLAEPQRFPGNLVDPVAIGVCINDLAKEAVLPQSTASYHLGLMQKAGLLTVTQHGQWRYVRADREAFRRLADYLTALTC